MTAQSRASRDLLCQRATRSFGARVEFARKRRGWTQNDLAEEIGCSRHVVQRLEAGRSPPCGKNIFLLAAVLGVSLNEPENPAVEHANSSGLTGPLDLTREDIIALIKYRLRRKPKAQTTFLRMIDLTQRTDEELKQVFQEVWGEEIAVRDDDR